MRLLVAGLLRRVTRLLSRAVTTTVQEVAMASRSVSTREFQVWGGWNANALLASSLWARRGLDPDPVRTVHLRSPSLGLGT